MERAEYERMRWRCVRRGLLELDLILTRFLDQSFQDLSAAEQSAFAKLVDEEDYLIMDLLHAEQMPTDDPVIVRVLTAMQQSMRDGRRQETAASVVP